MTARRPRPAGPLPVTLPMPTAWARDRIGAGAELGALPDYGSPEWAALDDEDPRKLAAALVAAEVHRYEVATLAERLHAEIAEARYAAECAAEEEAVAAGAAEAMERAERFAEQARQVGEAGAAQLLGRRPTHAQLVERRAESSPRPATTSPSSARRWPPVPWPPANPRAELVPAGRAGGGIPSVWVTMRPRSA